MKNKRTILTTILHELINGKSVTSIDTRASNTNQYFKTIKDHGIVLVEESNPNPHNNGRHKSRTLKNEPENIQRAKDFLQKKYKKNNKSA
ncbi:MAG: Unknown protein [uncultured Sulfurovum sp.]|uniref:Uncharacterized protein n=1 Tax=uncultured Sulfurovum sp. TaxID=269237 RepID=A0A6S6SCE9_9BACT|nr:MAG: Unknown protein [uncultured Sulfurovum sp.]